MCGRYTLRSSWTEIVRLFGLKASAKPLSVLPRYNIAALQEVPIIRSTPDGGREVVTARWGLIPASSMMPDNKNPLINARAETIMEEIAFKTAFQRRRCLVPADGFYEWQAVGGEGKQPHLIGMTGGDPFAIAGIWEPWKGPDGPVISFAIVTTSANRLVSRIHDRMPAILDKADWDAWPDLGIRPGEAMKMLQAFPAEAMMAYKVDKRVNVQTNDDPQCVEPLTSGA